VVHLLAPTISPRTAAAAGRRPGLEGGSRAAAVVRPQCVPWRRRPRPGPDGRRAGAPSRSHRCSRPGGLAPARTAGRRVRRGLPPRPTTRWY